MVDALKDYHPTGKGRPPTDPKKLKLWKAANKALHAKNDEETKELPREKVEDKKKRSPTKKASATAVPLKRAGGTKAALPANKRQPRGLARVLTPPATKQNTVDKDPLLLPDNKLHDIIALCRKEGISHLALNGLVITFATAAATPAASTGPKDQEKTVPNEGTPVSEAQGPSLLTLSSDVSDDLSETQSLIDDPLAYEEAEIDRHLNGGADSAGSQAGRAESDLRGSGVGR
jgi:hypothetical protein